MPNHATLSTRLRAWADLHGVLTEELELDLAECIAHKGGIADLKIPLVIGRLQKTTDTHRFHDITNEQWLQVLQQTATEPVAKRLIKGCTHCLLLKVTHTGCSNTQSTSWFRYIEARLEHFSKQLSHDDIASFRWYSRLVHKSQSLATKCGTYEGCYLLQLFAEDADPEEAHRTVEAQLSIIRKHESTLAGKCFISYEILTPEELAKEEEANGIFVNCTKPIVRPFISPPKPLQQETNITAPPNPARTQPPPNTNMTTNNEPKAKLRTAPDIHSRILHDARYNADEYVVGYIDRFSDIPLEIGVNDWCRVKEDESFIPESRVVYFKRRWREGGGSELSEHIVWDRVRRIDEVFWSGDSTKIGKS